MVFDVWMTNNAIYPYYERLNLSGTAAYGAFSSVFPPVSRMPGEQVKVTVASSGDRLDQPRTVVGRNPPSLPGHVAGRRAAC